MLKIQIRFEQIFLRFKFSDQPNLQLQFYLKQNGQPKILAANLPFNQQNQQIDCSHIIYQRQEDLQNLKLNYGIGIKGQNDQNEFKNKYIGDLLVDFKELDLDRKYPLKADKQIQIQKCVDSQAKVKFQIRIDQIPQFRNAFGVRSKIDKNENPHQNASSDISQGLAENYVHQQYEKQLLQQVVQNKNRLLHKKIRYQTENQRLKEQNSELTDQIAQKQQMLLTNKLIREDRLSELQKKVTKTETEYLKTKQDIGRIFNLLNEIGNLQIVEGVSNILIK